MDAADYVTVVSSQRCLVHAEEMLKVGSSACESFDIAVHSSAPHQHSQTPILHCPCCVM